VGRPAAFEYKYDGFRLIISKENGKISLFTRRLENVTKQFPDVVEYVSRFVNGNSFMIDCEVVGYDPGTKKYLPFQSISQRIKRKYEIEKMIRDFPVEVNVFDLLFFDGDSYLNKPFIERTKLIRKIIKNNPYKLVYAKQLITGDEKKAEEFFQEALKNNEEGVMIKNLQGIYKPGSRVGYMVKLKPEHRDLDLVIVGAEYGTGKRAGWLSSFILACRDNDKFLEVGRVGTGIKEKSEEGVSFKELTKLLKPFIIEHDGRNVRVSPKIVVAIIYQEIQKSPTYSSGYALRFPRVTALRVDKPVNEVNSLGDIEKEYSGQK
jgi:DNA ligase-1